MTLTRREGWPIFALSLCSASTELAVQAPAGAGAEQAIVVAAEPQPWGTAADIALVVGAGDNLPPSNTVTWNTSASAGTGVGVFQTSTTTVNWWYQVQVPSGALLLRATIEACDTSTTGELLFGIARGVAPGGASANISAVASTGLAATPGCAYFQVSPTAATTVDNAFSNYWVFIDWSGAGAFAGGVRLNSIRVLYRLQVSPAPATATFPNDVPTTHPFFRFVEALAASGVTGGCGAGSYCPDAPVTRGQMAVFLATSLGMHSAP